MRLLCCLLAVCASIIFHDDAGGQESRPKNSAPTEKAIRPPAMLFVPGAIVAIDLKLGTITVKHRKTEATYSLADEKIPITGDVSGLPDVKDLPAGTQVLLKLSASDDVVGIHCIGPQISTRLEAIDTKKRTVTLPGGQTLALNDKALVAVGTRFPKAEDVPTGNAAVVRLTIDRGQIVRMTVRVSAESVA